MLLSISSFFEDIVSHVDAIREPSWEHYQGHYINTSVAVLQPIGLFDSFPISIRRGDSLRSQAWSVLECRLPDDLCSQTRDLVTSDEFHSPTPPGGPVHYILPYCKTVWHPKRAA